ncbi:jg17485 [Pararge aegeria aegeria]|uniref:Jg17485 protein n=1 Tax=Pararge aegeria aegeria TaxID=348720 RepID=A0A8S4RPK3_9NEOP|nr:jg17485 [Pararge aegeria aegeria]
MAQAEDKPHYDSSNGPALFEKFIKDYNKVYKDDADKEVHYQAFLKSLKVINEANAAQSSATFDLNEFADYTPEQRKFLHGVRVN